MVTQEELEKMSPEEIAELQKANCIFCKIAGGDIPAKKVYEDELVLGFMDIHPARKGHVLLIPKEHYQIFPLVPPPTFKRMFERATIIGEALKKTCLTPDYILFAANGAVAGQQIPHAVLHIFPKEQGDALASLEIPQRSEHAAANETLSDALKHNLPLMYRNHLEREGRLTASSAAAATDAVEHASTTPKEIDADAVAASPSSSSTASSSAAKQERIPPSLSIEESQQVRREHIATLLEDNMQVREALKADPQAFKSLIQEDEQLVALFAGVDIDALAAKLSQIDGLTTEEETPEGERHEVTPAALATTSTEQLDSPPQQEMPEQENTSVSSPTKPTDDLSSLVIFTGPDPQAKQEEVFSYFRQKPQALALFVSDLEQFKNLLAQRPDVQPIFTDVNLDALQQHLQRGQDVASRNTDPPASTNVSRPADSTGKRPLEDLLGGDRK